jgi:hypothetical protein
MRKLCVLALLIAVASGAALAADGDSSKDKQWYDRIKFGGDLRLRYEGFWYPEQFDDGRRDRFRFRLRVGMKAQVKDNLEVGFRLVSGNPDNPISDNQSFDSGFDKTTIAISDAYVKYAATDFFDFYGGKFRPKGVWSATDFEWDDDLSVEGLFQAFGWKFGGAVKKLDFNIWQYVMNESGSGSDSFNFGGQIVPTFGLGKKNDLAVGVTYNTFDNPSAVAGLYFDGDLVIDSGYITNFVDPGTGELTSDFRVGSVLAQWKNKSLDNWPIKLTVYYYKNFGATDDVGAILPAGDIGGTPLAVGRGTDNDTAYFARLQVGDYKKPGQVAVRVSRYDSNPDAIFFAYSQSDTRRSSNVDGWRTDVRVGMPAKNFINVTWYHTDWMIGDGTTMDRLQVDYIFKF